jgi:beta propeller repeat protein
MYKNPAHHLLTSFASITIALLISLTLGASSAQAATVQITNNDYPDSAPVLDDGKLVWLGFDGNDSEVFLYDFASETTTQVTDNTRSERLPQIDAGQIVWETFNREIFFYDIASETTTQVTNTPQIQDINPQINAGQIVWVAGDDFFDREIFLYNIASGTTIQVTNNSTSDNYPDIYEGQIVWESFDGNDMEIFLYDIASGAISQITNNTHEDNTPEIQDGRIVWVGSDADSDQEIFLYNIASGATSQITNNIIPDEYPQISGGQIVWGGNDSNGTTEVFLYNIATGTTTQITDGIHDARLPQIDDGKIVWAFFDGTDSEIFLWDGPSNQAPILNPIGNKTVNEGELLEFTISATDTDGDNLTYSAINLPQGATFNTQTATFTWTPSFSQAGNFENIEFTVTDDGNPIEQDSELITITVEDVTPAEQAANIVTDITEYNFPANVENAYLSNLKKVEEFIEEGKIQPAINQLNAFISKVESDYANGTITQAVRDDLVRQAQALLAELQQ